MLPPVARLLPFIDDARPAAAVAVGVAGGSDPRGFAAASKLLGEAQRLATERWPGLLRPCADPVRLHRLDLPLNEDAIFFELPACDILLVIDGVVPIAMGEALIRAALSDGIPVLHVPAATAPRLIRDATDELGLIAAEPQDSSREADAASLAALIFSPPPAARQTRRLREYLAEGPPRRSSRYEYDLMLRLLGPRERQATRPAPDPWAAVEVIASAAFAESWVAEVRRAQDHADRHAAYYGGKWRSAAAARSFLLLLPMLVSAAIGIALPQFAMATVAFQVLMTLIILVDRRAANRGRWQQKWIEYRTLAERLRCLRFLRLAGLAVMHDDARPAATWIDWYVKRLERALGEPQPVTAATAGAVIDHILDVEIREQLDYHRVAKRRFVTLDVHLRLVGHALLAISLGTGTLLFGYGLLREGTAGIPWPTLVSLGLSIAPALVAALNNVRGDFDLAHMAERSARTIAGLSRLARAARRRPASPELAHQIAERAAEIMENEASRWQGTIETRAARLNLG